MMVGKYYIFEVYVVKLFLSLCVSKVESFF